MNITGPSGTQVEVNVERQMDVDAIMSGLEFHTNLSHQYAFILDISETPTGADDCFGLIQNVGDDIIVVTEFVGQCAANEVFYFQMGANGTPAGTHNVIAPVNRYAGSGNLPTTNCESGADITGCGGATLEYLAVPAGQPSVTRRWEAGFVLPHGYEFSVWATTGTAAVVASLCFFVKKHPAMTV